MRGVWLLLTVACTAPGQPAATAELPFADDFERSKLGANYSRFGGDWIIDGGTLKSIYAINIPLFVNVDLPADVVVEVDVRSDTSKVDVKVELMTDGRRHESGYIFIFGGWDNALSCIARLDEHGRDRKTKRPTGAVGNQWYRWRIEKKGGSIKWFVDNNLYIEMRDSKPLEGPNHNRMAFTNWQNEVRYDNLRIWPYDQAPPRGASGERQ